MPDKVLIVDDDKNILKLLQRYLSGRGYRVAFSNNASDGLMLARAALPDLIISDADMPDLDGHSFCRFVKKDPALCGIPFIIMSGSHISECQVLDGYEGGAEDYLIKPFSLPIMLAKIRTVLRTGFGAQAGGVAVYSCGLEIYGEGRAVTISGEPVRLTRKEFDLLALLAGKEGRVLSSDFLLENIWGYETAGCYNAHTLEVHVSRLRKKLGGKAAAHIRTVTGCGYKFEN